MLLTDAPERLLDRVRKLLAQAEDDAVTPAEAQAFTAKAAELMAKYGIDRALLAAERPETDQPANRILDIDNPWAREKAHLLCGLASALRCQCILLNGTRPGSRVHVFGFGSDIERTDLLYTSVLIQMAHGLAGARVPDWSSSPRAWRRSWLLGFATAVIARVRQAEHGAMTVGYQPRRSQLRPHRDRPGRPLRRNPPASRAGLPGHQKGQGHLQRQRLPGRLRARPARRHRRHSPPPPEGRSLAAAKGTTRPSGGQSPLF